jgi:hypothetical protein
MSHYDLNTWASFARMVEANSDIPKKLDSIKSSLRWIAWSLYIIMIVQVAQCQS